MLLLFALALDTIDGVWNFLRPARQIRVHLKANKANGFKGSLVAQALAS